VLDAGGGTGSTTFLVARAAGPTGSVVTLDLSSGMLAEARARAARTSQRARVSLTLGDMLRLPFLDGRFDVVLSTYSACPLTDPAAAAEEMLRVVRPGGLLGVAHSSEPRTPVVRWMANRFEDLAWRFPRLSLGCRPVSVLPRLLDLGAEVTMHERIGIPLWPFEVFVVRKPG
jgi:ubiquinone/menaquinone biosynthesis C-methylase UbiE